MSRVSQVSKRYAKALFSSVQKPEAVLNELRVLVQALTEDKSTIEFFASSLYTESLKKEVLEKALGNKAISEDLKSFLSLLVNKGRLQHISDILISFEELVDGQNGITRGSVRSAVKLDQDARQKIEKVVSHFVKKKVILTYSEDASLVGGVVAQVGGWTFEDTLDSHLRRLKEDLNRRAN